MMLRFRRYRAFLAVAVVVTISLYHLFRIRSWDAQSIGVDKLKILGNDVADTLPSKSPSALSVLSENLGLPTAGLEIPLRRPSSHMPTSTSTQSPTLLDVPPLLASSTPVQSSAKAQLVAPSNNRLAVDETERLPDEEDAFYEFESHGQGRLEIDQPGSLLEGPHWLSQKEHFPVPSNLVIPLPTGQPKQIPHVQHVFATEDSTVKKSNERKRAAVRAAFENAWGSYKKYAIPHDELAPISRDFKDPFNGWGATLVDALDTLWIMDLKDEFEEAVAEVEKINFKTSIRKDIPLFETVIRYLGGLIAAYDVSSGNYKVLLDKAVELAEVLMGAFDTPNRMPVTYYNWAPAYASQPHRAASKVVLAELGSLSLEFTRLAQITKEDRYYDAIARITNELQSWQNNTKLPGLWPVSLDASGCQKPDRLSLQMAHSASHGPQELLPPIQNAPTRIMEEIETKPQKLDRRQLDDAGISSDEEPALTTSDQFASANRASPDVGAQTNNSVSTMDGVECQPQGLASPPFGNVETFTMGGMSDSAYEYLPKEWLLLGGLNNQYESMYRKAMSVVTDKLLFRPMAKTGRDILFAGTLKIRTSSKNQTELPEIILEHEGQHLTCFAGGMFALGAKVFGIKGDLEIAKRLTDGCVWAYESTTTGIMPEVFHMVPCSSPTKCKWNETKWWDALDPYRAAREKQAKAWYERQEFLAQEESKVEADRPGRPGHPDMPVLPIDGAEPDVEQKSVKKASTELSEGSLHTRQLADFSEASEEEDEVPTEPTRTQPGSRQGQGGDKLSTTSQPASPAFTPKSIATHEEYVQARIKEERLPPGFADISSKKYILRPEAIESVFIMYRVTGDKYWQDQGWKMFTAIQTYTSTEEGNSAISDVTSEVPSFLDEMESFWLAETLKYFYLLYSDPDLISLDDYVL